MQPDVKARDLRDYIVVLRKRKDAILIIASAIIILTLVFALLLPTKYKSNATILIERQEIPPELVMSTVTSYASERIQTIKARVMSRSNLLKIIEKYNLYADKRKYETTEQIIAYMRADTRLDLISADVIDPRTGKSGMATIAFSLSYTGEIPTQTQQVASELSTLYLDENLKSRTQKAEETSLFLGDEVDRLSKVINEYETKIAEFKTNNRQILPEMQPINAQRLQVLEAELVSNDTKLQILSERQIYLESQLSMTPVTIAGGSDKSSRLKEIEAAYASMISRYSDSHPDVIRIKSEIDSLKKELGTANTSADLKYLIASLTDQLADMQTKYTDTHPDVVSLKEKITSLESEMARAIVAEKNQQVVSNNPAYITAKSQIDAVGSEKRNLLNRNEVLKKDIFELQQVRSQAPEAERQYLTLIRDYNNAKQQYIESKNKQMKADMARQLESENKGERFTLIDPAAVPEIPISPNRPAIIFMGVILGFVSAIGYAFFADIISNTVRGAQNIEHLTGLSPLSVIPYKLNKSDSLRKIIFRKRVAFILVCLLIMSLLLIHFLFTPLDVLWFRLLRKSDAWF